MGFLGRCLNWRCRARSCPILHPERPATGRPKRSSANPRPPPGRLRTTSLMGRAQAFAASRPERRSNCSCACRQCIQCLSAALAPGRRELDHALAPVLRRRRSSPVRPAPAAGRRGRSWCDPSPWTRAISLIDIAPSRLSFARIENCEGVRPSGARCARRTGSPAVPPAAAPGSCNGSSSSGRGFVGFAWLAFQKRASHDALVNKCICTY